MRARNFALAILVLGAASHLPGCAAFLGSWAGSPSLMRAAGARQAWMSSPARRLRVQNPSRVRCTADQASPPEVPKAGGLPAWLLPFIVPALGGALFGWDIGSSSSVVRIIGQGTTEFGQLDPFQLGLLASTSLFGAMGMSAAIIAIGDKVIGRKTELILAATIFGAGTALEALAPTFGTELAGRALYGVGIGTAMHVAPLYIAESVPSNLRGTLVSLKEAAIVLGIVAGYAVGAAFGAQGGWREVYAAALPVEALMLAGALAVPESARWLALRGRASEAEEAIIKAQGLDPTDAKAQVAEMTAAAAANAGDAEEAGLQRLSRLVSAGGNRKALTIGVGLVLAQQLSGQPSVLYYANRIFERAGLGYEAAVGVGLFKAAMTLVSVQLVEDPKWGRRPLLLAGTAVMTLALTGLSLLFIGGAETVNQGAVMACIVAFVGGYQIGFGPITWLILSEVFPLNIRSAAVSVGTLVNFGSNLLVTLLFEAERTAVGESLLFLQFAIIAGLAVAFEYFYVPETRGLSLEQIEAKIRGNEPPQSES